MNCSFLVLLAGIGTGIMCYHLLFIVQSIVDGPEAKSYYKLVIGVLSARQNFKQREAIRQSWLGHIKNSTDLSQIAQVQFVIGQHPCQASPDDRVDPYSCNKWSPEVVFEKDFPVISSIPLSDNRNHVTVHETMTFTVLHPVVLTRLGILHNIVLTERTDAVLYVCNTDDRVVGVSFSMSDSGIMRNGYKYQSVEHYILPKGFEGQLVVEGNFSYVNGGYYNDVNINAAELTSVIDIKSHSGIIDKVLYLVSFMFSIYDNDSLQIHVAGREKRAHVWTEHLLTEMRSLDLESKANGDILLVDMIDVYRNLPIKLLRFHQWIQSNLKFSYVLKTDDDCFLDIVSILRQLNELNADYLLWWGNFRNDWYVERCGKWGELDYTASAYPSFACGSGHVLSSPASQWIADNAEILKVYQGEDVSMGIWFAAINAYTIDDKHWQCTRTCTSSALSIPELSPQEMSQMWKNKLACGNPCEC